MAQVDMPKSSIGQKPEQPKKKFEKVVKGKVIVKEQNDIQKIANEFLAEDLKTVKDRIIVDYLLPMLKNGLCSVVNSAISIALFGDDRSRNGSTNYGSGTVMTATIREARTPGREIRAARRRGACRIWTLSSAAMQTTRWFRCMTRSVATVRYLWATCGI